MYDITPDRYAAGGHGRSSVIDKSTQTTCKGHNNWTGKESSNWLASTHNGTTGETITLVQTSMG